MRTIPTRILYSRSLWLLLLTACIGLTCQRRPQAAIPASESQRFPKFALQVGIDDYQYVNQLDGCVQDILDMKAVLIQKFGFPEKNILTLTNRQATHEAIIAAFKTQLIENARKNPNAIVVFQYSGHGSQVDDTNGDEADKLDETLVSADSRDPENKHFDIIDDELNDLFEQLSQYTSNITFILDSCHSESATRAPGKVRSVPKDVRPQPPQPPLASSRSTSQTRDGDRIDVLPRNERYVTISGSRSTEVSNERRGSGGRTTGAMTYYLIRALQRARPDTTYRELMEEVAKAVTLEFPAQHPQVEGDIRRNVLGGAADREDPFIKITRVNGKIVMLEAGAAQGIKEGTPVAIYAPDARRLAGEEKKLAIATVTKVSPLSSTAQLLEAVSIPTNAKAVLMAPNYGSARVRLALDAVAPGDPAGRIIAGVREELKTSKTIEVVDAPVTGKANSATESSWDVALLHGKFGDVFKDKGSIAPAAEGESTALPEAGADVCYLAGGDGFPLFGFFVRPTDPRGVQKITAALEHLAKQRTVKALSNEARAGSQAFRITPIRVFGSPTAEGFKVEKEELAPVDQLDYDFEQGAYFKFQIENQSGKDMYVTLFDLGTDGSIQILYPPAGAADLLKAGAKIKTQSVFVTTGPAGYETFKVIATTNRTDFSFLAAEAVSRDPLSDLMEGALLRPRSGVVKVAGVDDWTTSQIDFAISEHKKP